VYAHIRRGGWSFMDKLVVFKEIDNFLVAEVLIEKLDLFETPNVLSAVEEALAGKQPTALIVDLKSVDTIDSSGIGFLIAVRNNLMKKQIPFAVIGVGEMVMQVFKLTKVIQLIQVYSSLDEALGAFKK
jgi:anti-anti-sigma factor